MHEVNNCVCWCYLLSNCCPLPGPYCTGVVHAVPLQVKIADFGLAKQSADAMSTVCGTPQYVAPEVIQGTAHTVYGPEVRRMSPAGLRTVSHRMWTHAQVIVMCPTYSNITRLPPWHLARHNTLCVEQTPSALLGSCMTIKCTCRQGAYAACMWNTGSQAVPASGLLRLHCACFL